MNKNILESQSYRCKVSTVLNKDVTQYGKSFMFDGKEETCWCSEQGSPQRIQVLLDIPTNISSFQIQFQGGFVGQDCECVITEHETEKKITENFYPEDINSLQTFRLSQPYMTKQIVFNFNSSTDFFGRIIIYKLLILSDDSS